MSEPNAPPVMMIGPSAPNGPPEPIEIAAESGFRTARRGPARAPRGWGGASPAGKAGPRKGGGEAGLDTAAADQDRLERFRNAVTANAIGAVAGDEPDEECAQGRDEQEPAPERMRVERARQRVELLKEKGVREERDELQEPERH